MSAIQEIRCLWRIPPTPRQCAKSKTSSLDERSSTLRKAIGLSDSSVFDMSPGTFRDEFFQSWVDIPGSSPVSSSWVVAITGDLVRDKIGEKSLPLYIP